MLGIDDLRGPEAAEPSLAVHPAADCWCVPHAAVHPPLMRRIIARCMLYAQAVGGAGQPMLRGPQSEASAATVACCISHAACWLPRCMAWVARCMCHAAACCAAVFLRAVSCMVGFTCCILSADVSHPSLLHPSLLHPSLLHPSVLHRACCAVRSPCRAGGVALRLRHRTPVSSAMALCLLDFALPESPTARADCNRTITNRWAPSVRARLRACVRVSRCGHVWGKCERAGVFARACVRARMRTRARVCVWVGGWVCVCGLCGVRHTLAGLLPPLCVRCACGLIVTDALNAALLRRDRFSAAPALLQPLYALPACGAAPSVRRLQDRLGAVAVAATGRRHRRQLQGKVAALALT
jgi:hypothetical protein